MRLRPLATLSIAAVSALLFTGCATGSAEPTPSPSASGAVDLCDAIASSGPASEAIKVEGEVGKAPKVTIDAPVDVPELQATLLEEGTGEKTQAGDYVQYALTAFGAESGEELGRVGYEEGELLPAQLSAESPLGQFLGCSAPGSRVAVAVPETPATEQAQGYAAELYVIDLLSVVPTAAWGEPQEPKAGMPTVTLADDGAPTIELPGGDAPTKTEVATLRAGDGYEVKSGDGVLIQYSGVRWSNGEVFDETWNGKAPIAQATTRFVPGFQKALEGQKVGSQVLVVIPPAEGYGEAEINETDLKGDTLVFVVDILGAQRTQTQ